LFRLLLSSFSFVRGDFSLIQCRVWRFPRTGWSRIAKSSFSLRFLDDEKRVCVARFRDASNGVGDICVRTSVGTEEARKMGASNGGESRGIVLFVFFTASFSLVGWFRACHACAFFCYSFSSSRDASGSVRREEDDDDDWSSRTNTANSRRVTESWAAASASPDFSARHWRISFLFSSFPFPSFIFRSLSLK